MSAVTEYTAKLTALRTSMPNRIKVSSVVVSCPSPVQSTAQSR
jgi:hypothetical protein